MNGWDQSCERGGTTHSSTMPLPWISRSRPERRAWDRGWPRRSGPVMDPSPRRMASRVVARAPGARERIVTSIPRQPGIRAANRPLDAGAMRDAEVQTGTKHRILTQESTPLALEPSCPRGCECADFQSVLVGRSRGRIGAGTPPGRTPGVASHAEDVWWGAGSLPSLGSAEQRGAARQGLQTRTSIVETCDETGLDDGCPGCCDPGPSARRGSGSLAGDGGRPYATGAGRGGPRRRLGVRYPVDSR